MVTEIQAIKAACTRMPTGETENQKFKNLKKSSYLGSFDDKTG